MTRWLNRGKPERKAIVTSVRTKDEPEVFSSRLGQNQFLFSHVGWRSHGFGFRELLHEASLEKSFTRHPFGGSTVKYLFYW